MIEPLFLNARTLININNEVIGIACRGADNIDNATDTDLNGILSIEYLNTEKDD